MNTRYSNSDEKASALRRMLEVCDMYKKSWFLLPSEGDISSALSEYNCEWTEELEELYDKTKRKQLEFEKYFQCEVENAAIELAEVTMKERGYNTEYERIKQS